MSIFYVIIVLGFMATEQLSIWCEYLQGNIRAFRSNLQPKIKNTGTKVVARFFNQHLGHQSFCFYSLKVILDCFQVVQEFVYGLGRSTFSLILAKKSRYVTYIYNILGQIVPSIGNLNLFNAQKNRKNMRCTHVVYQYVRSLRLSLI